jgi:Ion transport protein
MSMPSFHSSFSSEDDGYGSCDNTGGSFRRDYRKRRRPMATDVFANDALTSFRVSRRSLRTSDDDDRGNKSSKENYNLKIRKSKDTTKTTTIAPQSTSQASSRSYTNERLEGSANTLIIEEPLPEETLPNGSREMQRNERNISLRSLLSSTSSRRSVNREFAVLVEEGADDNPESTNQQQQQEKIKWVSSFRTACGNFVNSIPIQIFMSLMLVANAIVLGLLTVESLSAITIRALEVTDEVMLCAFTLEILLHGIYLGPRRLLQDSWLTFDFLIILFSWCFSESNLNVMRSFRIFRIFSLVSRWESLRSLFEAIGSTIPRMSSIWLSLLLCKCFTFWHHDQFTIHP